MDDIDRASEREQMDRDLAIKAAAALALNPEIPPCGSCYNCEAILTEGLRFCDSDCMADFETRERAKRRAYRN